MTAGNQKNDDITPYRLAAGLMFQDRHRLLLLYIIIILPNISGVIFNDIPTYVLLILERMAQLIFLTLISSSWIKTFHKNAHAPGIRSIIIFLLTGFLIWMTITVPILIQLIQDNNQEGAGLSILFLIPAFYLLNKYFFYFFPILNGVNSAKRIMQSSLSITEKDANLPIKTLIPALGYFSLATTCLMTIAPDGRNQYVNILVSSASGLFWFLHCYTALAASLLYWGEKDWYESNLEPYRNPRILSLSITAPKFLSHLLHPKQGIIALVTSLLFWFANMLYLQAEKPAPEIKLIQTSLREENIAVIELELYDPEYKYRGFQPVNFVIAGETRSEVCNQVITARIKQDQEDYKFSLPASSEKINLTLEFRCSRNAEGLKKLEDLNLWYRAFKLFKIKL